MGINLEDAAPDHGAICRSRNMLIELGLLEKRFAELDKQLDEADLIRRRGLRSATWAWQADDRVRAQVDGG